ncbi:MAG: carboxypeptidase-like regulatory domain-containing protein, partial [Bryobacteraceae bacterium]
MQCFLTGRSSMALLVFLLAFLVPTLLDAQTTGVITGTVTDGSGATVPNARVLVRNTGTGEVRNLATNDSGVYVAYSLPVGVYEVEVSANGFKKASRGSIQLSVADRLGIN